jgi:hypothetical protein
LLTRPRSSRFCGAFRSLLFRVVMLSISFWCIAKIELQEGFW